MTTPSRGTRSAPFRTKELGPGHTLEYFYLNSEMWVREACDERTLETTLSAYLRDDQIPRMRFFAGLLDRLDQDPGTVEETSR